MKTKLLLFASVLFMLWSCEESLTTDVNTTFDSEVDIQTTPEAGSKKAGTYIFYQDVVLDFADNKDIQKNIEKLKALKFNSAQFVITNIPEGAGVEFVSVTLPDYNITAEYINIVDNIAIIWASSDVEKLNKAAEKIMAAKKVRIVYSGVASGEFTFKLKTAFPAVVTVGL